MKKRSGFTLIELMIVVAIIAIIAAIAIPNLLRSRMQSNESAAVGNLRTIVGAQVAYHAANFQYAGDFASLTTPAAGPSFLDGNWAAPKNGYNFTLAAIANNQDFNANGDPVEMNTTGSKGFFVNASGVVRFVDGGVADATSTPIGEQTGG